MLLVNVICRNAQVVANVKVQWLHVPWICLEVNLIAWVVGGWLVCVLQGACDAFERVSKLLVLGLVVQIEDPTQAAVTEKAIFCGK